MNDKQLQEAFTVHILPAVERHAHIYFRHIKCLNKRADLIAEAVGLAWKWFKRMAERGKDGCQFPTVIATFAAKPDEQAAFRIDFPAWLGTFDSRRRDILLDMALGWQTQELAKKYGVSAGRISQMRREAATDWDAFHGGQAA
jgi:hypothetical protein